jgi:ribosomal protein S18 acetylase RimI-like enzyme
VTLAISPLGSDEVDALLALAREIWRAHYPPIIGQAQTEYMLAQRYTPEVVRAELARGELWWDTLSEDGEIVAFASSFAADAPGAIKLDKLYVHPQRQRRGYGAALIEHTCERAKRLGMEKIVLAVNKRNASAIAAYRSSGFEIAGAVVKDIGGGFVMDDFVMERKLSPLPPRADNEPLSLRETGRGEGGSD